MDLVQANREKFAVALMSVAAAVFLTGVKLAAGIVSGSLGIMAEAAHSGLDLAAAGMTLFAVRAAGRPADREHTYGHGKYENLSALFETLLLLATCVWIVWEALQRLCFTPGNATVVEANLWGFGVMAVSMVVDYSRSRALRRAALKYHSQALEADALHFATDIWSSGVVLCGLGLVYLAGVIRQPWLKQADAVAALGVAAIVAMVSVRMGKKTIDDLLDAIPSALPGWIEQAARIEGVLEVKRVRVRRAGRELFADMTVLVAGGLPLERAHEIASQVEEAVKALAPDADVVVHVEPPTGGRESVLATIRRLAARHGLGAHSIRIYHQPDGQSLELHLEVNEALELQSAHAQATAFEADVRAVLPQFIRVDTHLEPSGEGAAQREATPIDEALIIGALRNMPPIEGLRCHPHDLKVQRVGGEISLTFHCLLDPKASIAQAHSATEKVEQALRARVPHLGRVNIHVEPDDGGA